MTRPASPAGFTPALGHHSLTGLYDAVIALMTRERVWRSAQALDGIENTRLNAAGGLPDLIAEAGFEGVEEREVLATATGSISLYRAEKPRGRSTQPSQEIGHV